MKNIKLVLQYDGTTYHGFQIQPTVTTIQGVLESTVQSITGEDVRVYGCSRTDAGVHAVKYVAGFRLQTPIPPEKIALVLNNALPDDIRILSSEEADEDFHPRFSCMAKKYRYVINTDPDAGVFSKNYEWQLRHSLNAEAMQKAAQHIIGTHDFRSFMTTGPEMETTVRTVYSLDVETDGPLINIYIKADGYLYNMVRIITGTLVKVGEGKLSPDAIPEIIKKEDRNFAGPTAPPQGLALYEIYY
ncbi:MAG: tRNA pseudouridine(38-40) synthase TruA [Ruminococcaceae bacterium]|nr:tRNA pseudouridine(38-40) synthase TruA [Oscillospiraceae bacterium]